MRIHLVDPPAFTPSYDHALARALGRAGAEVVLVTSPFDYGEVPPPDGYEISRRFYRRGAGLRRPGLRRLAKLAQHAPDMVAYRRASREADVVHFQWFGLEPFDVHVVPRRRPLVVTAHDVLSRNPRPGQVAAQKRLYGVADAVVVHSAHGRDRLVAEAGVDPAAVHVIPHGAFHHLAGAATPRRLPPELDETSEPVVLCFGLLRPYKGIDVLLEAWRGITGAQLWIVGLPKMDVRALRAGAPESVRWVPRFVGDAEIPALFERADVVVLPYREIDQSGVVFTALAFGRPLLLSAVGGFPDIAATGAADLVRPGDPGDLRRGLEALLTDPGRRERLGAAARRAADGPYSWDAVARRTLALYERLLES